MFFGMLLVMGTRNGFGVFVSNWEEEWGVTTGDISIAAAIGWIVNGFSQPILGKIVDRYGGRVVVVISMIVLGISYLLLAFIDGVIMLAVLFGGVISFFAGGVSPGTSGAVITRWFQRKRGMAMSVVAAGGSLGGLIMVPFLDPVHAGHQRGRRHGYRLRHIRPRARPARFHRDTAQLVQTKWGCCQMAKPAPKTTQPPHSSESRAQAMMRGGPLGF